jgi:lipopolysaccharide assembly outer membrane protein LptD (OstA)
LKYTFSLIFSLIVLASCENSESNIRNFINTENLAVEQLTNSEIIYTENGNLKLKVMSQKMEKFSDKEERIELAGGVHFDFYKLDSTNTKSVITCDRATINNTTNIMIANGDVNIKIGDTIISTQQLIWDKNRKARYFEDGKGKNVKHENVDLIYSNYEVTKRYKESETSFLSFKITSDFFSSRVLDGDTIQSPFNFIKFSSDSIMSVPLK